LFAEYLAHAAAEKEAKASKDATKAELLLMVRAEMEKHNRSPDTDKAKVTCGGRKLSLSNVKGNPGVTVTEDMVGTVINKRSGYQRVTIS
jgi:hypothetical protein